MDVLGRELADGRCGIIGGHTNHDTLVEPGGPGMSDKRVEGDAAAG
jgi:hypothetical protein